MRGMRQLEFVFPVGHGGPRKGAGRKRRGERASVGHGRREGFVGWRVVHVTCRLVEGLRSLREKKTVLLLLHYLLKEFERQGFRVVEFSIQGNHLHLVCEAESREALSRAMNGLCSGMARKLNRHWGRRGKVFGDRYHAEFVTTPTQCRNLLIYVLGNAKKHGALPLDAGIDAFSTAPWFPFDGSRPNHPLSQRPKPAATPRLWLLREGWRRSGPITPHHLPRIPKQRSRIQPGASSHAARSPGLP